MGSITKRRKGKAKSGIGTGVTDAGILAMLKCIDEAKVPEHGRMLRVRLEVPSMPVQGQHHVGARYLNRGTVDHRIVVQEAVIKLNGPRIRKRFDTIVGTGISGALVVPTLAYLLEKDFLLIRKPDDKATHSTSPAEGTTMDGAKCLFVDDFSVSGATRDRCVSVCKGLNCDLRFIGEYYYGCDAGDTRAQKLEWYRP